MQRVDRRGESLEDGQGGDIDATDRQTDGVPPQMVGERFDLGKFGHTFSLPIAAMGCPSRLRGPAGSGCTEELPAGAAGATGTTLGHGVQVSVFCPGAIRTSALTGGKFGRIPGISDEELLKILGAVAADGTRKVRRARPSCRVAWRRNHCAAGMVDGPAWWKAWWYLERLSPALSMRLAKVCSNRLAQATAHSITAPLHFSSYRGNSGFGRTEW